MKRTTLALIIISALLVLVMNGIQPTNLAYANFIHQRASSPPIGSIPPIVNVSSPKNNTAYGTNNIMIDFDVSFNKTSVYLGLLVRYKADWLSEEMLFYADKQRATEYNESFQIPDGEHSLTISASGQGSYDDPKASTIYLFNMSTITVVNFTVDTVPPRVSILPLENETYNVSDVPLNFITSEKASQVSFVLDGLENVTVNGNTTLTRLNNGWHSLTVYAMDEAGNIGASNTIYFSVEQPSENLSNLFPIVLVAFLILVVIALVIYRKKNSRTKTTKIA